MIWNFDSTSFESHYSMLKNLKKQEKKNKMEYIKKQIFPFSLKRCITIRNRPDTQRPEPIE